MPKAHRVKAGSSQKSATQKRALFVEAYCANGQNGKQAAITAGFAPKSAEVTASRLLRHAKVKGAVEMRLAKALASAEDQTDFKAIDVLRSAGRVVGLDLRKLYDADGKMVQGNKLNEDLALSLELSGGKLKLDRTAAREQLMRHFGLYEADNKQLPPAVSIGRLTVGMDFKTPKMTRRVK